MRVCRCRCRCAGTTEGFLAPILERRGPAVVEVAGGGGGSCGCGAIGPGLFSL